MVGRLLVQFLEAMKYNTHSALEMVRAHTLLQFQPRLKVFYNVGQKKWVQGFMGLVPGVFYHF